jgi:hypothetical protein
LDAGLAPARTGPVTTERRSSWVELWDGTASRQKCKTVQGYTADAFSALGFAGADGSNQDQPWMSAQDARWRPTHCCSPSTNPFRPLIEHALAVS